jgi:hypothetical protein|nr:hypothetical protein [uncultured Oscillibacter sp.]
MSGGHDRLTPEGRRFLAELEKMKRLEVRVGYQAGEATDDEGVDMCDIALWNELGTSGAHPIPARPFLRQSVDGNEDKIRAHCAQQARAIARGGTAEEALKKIGIHMKGIVQKTIKEGSFVPNAPSTIRKKGSDKPLIDTGRLRQSVNYHIKPKGGGG